ncbi:MAG: type II toxin-antitoxin system VapC family toxin [Candidatus Margulisbacteria bacterium]|jgi:predicted nucleic acid-binding protein|nr:type II toxin-antitoxin system VapC family toxin [Candidatus Margulisiibacteriota bacterium]
MIVVLDVSGASQVIFHKEKMERFDMVLQEASLVIAPDLYVPELTNAIWKYGNFAGYTLEECNSFIKIGLKYVNKFVDSRELWLEAFRLGLENRHSIYDMYYLALARQNEAMLVTNDKELLKIGKKLHVEYCY